MKTELFSSKQIHILAALVCSAFSASAEVAADTSAIADTALIVKQEEPARQLVELSSICKTLYPDRMGLSPNESLLSLFQTIPGLMSMDDEGISEKISLKVDNESHIFDVNAVLRRIRVMDVQRVEIVNNPDANGGTAGVGVSVRVFLKRPTEGLHGNVALDYNTNGTIDPTMNFGWKKGKWALTGGASFYFDHSKTTTTIHTTDWKDGLRTESETEEVEKADSYGESVNLKIHYIPSRKNRLSLGFNQNHLKVKTWTTTITGMARDEEYAKDKQNSNSAQLNYTHTFNKECVFRFSTTARYQDNPHLYNYQNYGIHDKKTENTNTGSQTKHLYLEASQTFPLWKNAKLQIGEKLDNGLISDLTKIKVGDNSTYYDIRSTNSQTKAQIDWFVQKWQFQVGEVLDYFHYSIGFTNLPDKCNSTTTPQTYVSISYNINPQQVVHASYRTLLTRPSYKQIYPISTTMDVDNNFMLQDSLFRNLNNSKAHSFNVGHVFSGHSVSVSTNVKAILMNDVLTCVNKVWKNSEQDNFYTVYSSVAWTPRHFSTAISGSMNILSYKKSPDTDYENKHSFDLRWMGVVDLSHGWSIGANVQYNGPMWHSYGKMEDNVYASAHVSKTLGHWAFNAYLSDIFDMQIKTITNSETKRVETAEERDYQGLSVGVSYKF